jgi:tetratricopeptide (TPR) repeat protein
VADIFVSYTSSDRDWAFWIAQQLEKLSYTAYVHEWEIAGGGDIFAWMEDHHDNASHVLCVVSEAYLKAPYSALERRAAQWAAINKRPNFALPVFIEACEAPTLFAVLKRCDLHGLTENEAQARLAAFLKPASKPTGSVPFPGTAEPATDVPKAPVLFPGGPRALSNIPVSIPRHFLGREADLAAIEAALKGSGGRAAITTALHGLRGVGKTTLAAAYAERHRADYRATWWIKAETESTLRADLVGLGVRIGWVAADEKEEPALTAIMEHLRDEGDGILLIYDNANNSGEIRRYLPRSGAAQVIVTSNAPNWSGVAAPVAIRVWPKEIGADYLIAQAGRIAERYAAFALSEALGGLPLAHEQAAAYCDRLGISLAEYLKRFEATPVKLLDTERDAPAEYHDRITVAKTFALAIDEAAKVHPAAESLIMYAALLAPEPIPLYLFSEARQEFGEPFASMLAGDGLDEAVATLRGFALVDRESIPDERDSSIMTDCIRLHRLVRQVAAARREGEMLEDAKRELIQALASTYPATVYSDANAWPRARRLDSLALALVGGETELPKGSEPSAASLLGKLDSYRDRALAAFAEAQRLSERALAIREKFFGPDHARTAISLVNLASLLRTQGDFAGARPLFERALAIDEKIYGTDHPEVATDLNNLGRLLVEQDDFAGALQCYERALAIREKAFGFNNTPVALVLENLGSLLFSQHDLVGARRYLEEALTIREKILGLDHLDAAYSFNNLGRILHAQNDPDRALENYQRALAIFEKNLVPMHPSILTVARNIATLLDELGRVGDVAAFRAKYSIAE